MWTESRFKMNIRRFDRKCKGKKVAATQLLNEDRRNIHREYFCPWFRSEVVLPCGHRMNSIGTLKFCFLMEFCDFVAVG